MGKSDDLEMSDLSEPDAEPEVETGRLPERELEEIDKRFQTVEGQIAVALTKAADLTERMSNLSGKEEKLLKR